MPNDVIITPSTGRVQFVKDTGQALLRYNIDLSAASGLIIDSPLTSSVGIKSPNLADLSGNNTFAGATTFNGATTINGNLSVYGATNIFSASNIYITSSVLTVTDNILTLNALSPYQRYAGIEMYDTGSGTLSSILWDGTNDYFFLTGSGVNGKLITGPDGQTDLTSNYIPKATAGYKLGNSVIYETGSNIGIGTTNPGARLQINYTGDAAYAILNTTSTTDKRVRLQFTQNNNAGMELGTDYSQDNSSNFYFYDRVNAVTFGYFSSNKTWFSGNLGVGTVSPNYLTDIQSTSSPLTLNLKLNKNSITNDYAEIAFQLWNGAGTGANTFSGSGTSRPSVVLRAINENGSSAAGAFVVGTFTGGADNTTLNERFRISSAGNVGIGSTSPACKLDVAGTIRSSTNEIYGFGASDNVSIRAASSVNVMGLYTSGTEKVRIDANGNVGIGTTNPSAKLHIYASGSSVNLLKGVTYNDSNASFYNSSLEYYDTSTTNASTVTKNNCYAYFNKRGTSNITGYTIGNFFGYTQIDSGSASQIWDYSSRIEVRNQATASSLYHFIADAGYVVAQGGVLGMATERIGLFVRSQNQSALTLTNQYGIYIEDLGQSTNNYAFYSNVSAASNKYNIYAAGTANNYFAGYVGIGATSFVYGAANRGLLEVYGSSDALIALRNATANFYIQKSGNNFAMVNGGAGYMTFNTNGSDRLYIDSNGYIGIATTSILTTGGNAQLSISTNTTAVALSFGASNNDMSYIRRLSAGVYQWQTYNSGNTGQIHLQPYGGSVGIGTTSPSSILHVNSTTSGATLLRTDGTNGTLFSVVDDLSDSLMSVNNSAGLPVLEVFADDRIVAGQYGQNDLVVINNKVGIGTNNPTAKLYVTSSTSTPSAVFLGGSVGIGTSSPAYKLDITGSLGVNASTSDTNWPFVVSDNSSAGSRYSLNKMGSMGFNYADTYAQLQLLGSAGAYLDFSSVSGGDSNARLIYYSGGSSRLDLTYGFTTTITLNSTGVGIGTTGPSGELHIYGAQPAFRIQSSVSGSMQFGQWDGTYNRIQSSARDFLLISTDATNLIFSTNTTERMRITSGGNVGIGTSNPSVLLHISGSSNDGVAQFKIDGVNAPATFNWASTFINAALSSSRNYISLIGQGLSTRNSGYIGFNHSGIAGSATNFLTFGLYGVDNILNINGSGYVGIGTTAPTTPLHVVGVISGSSFSGAGTGLTGTATSLTVGNATSASYALVAATANNVNNGQLSFASGSGITISAGTFTANQSGNTAFTISLSSNSVTVGSTAIALGGTATTIAGLSSVTSTNFVGALTGTATTASYANALNPANNYTVNSLTEGGYLAYPLREYVINFTAQSTASFYPIAIDSPPGTDSTWHHSFSIDEINLGGAQPYNMHSAYGEVRGQGWSDQAYFHRVFHNYYDGAERSLLGIWRPTTGWYGFVIYVRGGRNYYVRTTSRSVVGYSSAINVGGTVTYAIKNAAGADVSGTSANIAEMLNLVNNPAGFFHSNSGYFDGNVGIGTTNALSRLDVRGSHTTGYGILNVISTDSSILCLDSTGTRDQALRLKYNGTDKWLVGMRDANEAFSFSNSSDTRLVNILQGGNVGIGTTSPASKLDVSGSISLRNTTVLSTGADIFGGLNYDIYGNIRVLRSKSAQADGMYIGYQGDGGPLRFFSNSGTTEFMTIATSGYVGVGTTNPSYKLHVNGGPTEVGGQSTAVFEKQSSTDGRIALFSNSTGSGYSSYIYIGSNPGRDWKIGKNVLNSGTTGHFQIVNDLNQLKMQINAADDSIIFPSASIGIGTTSPTQQLEVAGYSMAGIGAYRTSIYGNNGGSYLYFGTTSSLASLGSIGAYGALFNINSLNNDISFQYSGAEKMRITTGGHLGLGITDPTAYVNSNGTWFRPSLNGLYSSIYATTEAVVNLISSGSADGAAVGGVYFTRARAQGDAHFQIAAIKAFQAGTSNTIAGGTLYFYTKNNNGGTAATDPAMVIGSGGNVGIGTSGPVAKLHISGSGQTILRLDSDTTTNIAQVQVKANGDGVLIAGMYGTASAGNNFGVTAASQAYVGTTTLNSGYPSSLVIGNVSSIPIAFSTNNTERMRIDGSGNVGIGTTSPLGKLDVRGNITSSGQIRSDVGFYSGGAAGTTYFETLNIGTGVYIEGGANEGIYFGDSNRWIIDTCNAAHNDNADGELHFRDYTNSITRMLIQYSTGNVGIGTSTPSTRLTSYVGSGTISGTNDAIRLQVASYNNAARNTIVWAQDNNNLVLGRYGLEWNSGTSQMNFVWRDVYNNGVTSTELMRLTGGGNLGIGTTAPSASLHAVSTTSGATLLRTDGTNGTLFSVVDDLSDSLMSVNNSAGLPVLEVFADDRIVAGQYGQNDFVVRNNYVGIGTNNPTAKLYVTSSTSTPSALFLGGNVGIGSSSPSAKLVVNGEMQVQSSNAYFTHFNHQDAGNNFITTANGGATYFRGSSNNVTTMTVGGGGNVTLQRDLIVNGGIGNPYGNRIIVQGTATTYTLQDSTLRPTVYLNGDYPVVTLNCSATTNAAHGPTLQFTFNGLTTGGSTSRQIVIGANGVGGWLDFGFSGGGYGDNTNYNPHNGISGYNGTTAMRLFSNGLLVGSTGTYPNHITSTSYQLDVRGTGYFSGILTVSNVLIVGNYKSFFINGLSAATTQSRTYEIARIAIDYNDWNSTGTFEVELHEQYYGRGLKKVYNIYWGYNNTYGIRLVEYRGSADNNMQCRVGAPVNQTGDNYYLPVYVDVRNYGIVDVVVKTNRQYTTSNTPAIAFTYINTAPSPTNISDFTPDSDLEISTLTTAKLGGNTILTSASTSAPNLSIGGNAATVTTNANLSGDVTSTGNSTTIANNAVTTVKISNSNVTYAKIQNVSNSTVLGRITAGAGVVEELTGANIATIIGSNAVTNATNATTATTANALNASNQYSVTGITGSIQTTAVRETFAAVSSNTTVSIDLSTATVFNLSFTSTISAFNITNVNTSKVNSFTLITAPNGTAATIAWSFQTNGGVAANVKWSGTAPTATTTSGRFDVFSFVYDGTRWFGFTGGLNYN